MASDIGFNLQPPAALALTGESARLEKLRSLARRLSGREGPGRRHLPARGCFSCSESVVWRSRLRGLGGACGRPAASPRHAPAASPRRRLSLTAGNRPLPASHSPRLPRLSAVTELDTGPRWGLSGGVGAVVAGSTSLPGPWNALHGGSKAVSLVIRGGPGGARSLSFTSFFASTARLSAPGA